MTRLIAYLFLAVVIQGQAERRKSSADKAYAERAGNPVTPSSPTVRDSGTRGINQQAAEKNQKWASSQSQSYLQRLFAPENLPNFILSLVGIAGVTVATCSLIAISRQAREMRHQSIVLRGQLVEMRRQVKGMSLTIEKMGEANQINREALQAGQRAYIWYPPIDMECFSVDASGKLASWIFRAAIENGGSTPAWQVTNRINSRWQAEPLGDDFTYPDLGDESGHIPALVPQSKTYSQKITIGDSVIRDVYAGKLRLYLYGWATYHDVFGGTLLHRTEFCHEIRILEIKGNQLMLDVGIYGRHNRQT